MRKLYLFLIILFLPCLAYGWDGDIDFKTVALEVGSKYPAEDLVVVRSSAQWQQLWDIIQGNDISDGVFPMRAPQVDFSKYMLVGFFGGRQSAVLHSVEIKNISLIDNEVIVDVQKNGPEDFTTHPIFNSPFHVVAIPNCLTGAKFVIRGVPAETMPQVMTLGE